jgi:bacterioferritin-associated ferredoxin
MSATPKLSTEKISQTVSLPGRDELTLDLDVVKGEIAQARLSGRGCPEFLKLMQAWRPKLTGALADVPLPEGNTHSEILLREALLKARGEWDFPYKDEELCHCRAVATAKVDAAIVGGCHSVRAVARETSAGTSCGSCRPDTEAILDYRLRRS